MEDEKTHMVKEKLECKPLKVDGSTDRVDKQKSDSFRNRTQRLSHVSIQGSGRHHKIPVGTAELQTSILCPRSCCTYTELQRQELPPRGPTIMTSKYILCSATVSLVLCIMTVIIAKVDTDKTWEIQVRYDNLPECAVSKDDTAAVLPKICHVTIDINKDMPAPVYVYYSLTNFYQNHRRYLKSKSAAQLRAEFDDDEMILGNCEPSATRTYKGLTMYPCGLLAYTFLPDRFAASVGGSPLCPACNVTADAVNRSNTWEHSDTWAKKDIAWETDVSQKFKHKPSADLIRSGPLWEDVYGIQLPRVDDNDFIVWMRSAPLPKFKKLYRVIKNKSLKKGDRLTITVASYWNNNRYNAEKWISVNTVGSLGGNNTSLVQISLATAIFSFVTILVVVMLKSVKRATFEAI